MFYIFLRVPTITGHYHFVDDVEKLIATAKTRLRKRIEGDPFVQCQAVYEEIIKEIRKEIGWFNKASNT